MALQLLSVSEGLAVIKYDHPGHKLLVQLALCCQLRSVPGRLKPEGDF